MREPLENLLLQLGELNEFEGRPCGVTRAAPTAWRIRGAASLALAAGIALAICAPWLFSGSRAGTGSGPGVAATLAGANGFDFRLPHPCADDGAYAMLLFRTWSPDCGCELWQVHRPADGEVLLQFPVGERGAIPVRFAENPIGNLVYMAVARRQQSLPASAAEAERLLHCLNLADASVEGDAAVPDAHGTPALACAVEQCLPDDVSIISQPLLRR